MTMTLPPRSEDTGVWLPVRGYEGVYQVSAQGEVRAIASRRGSSQRVLKSYPAKRGGYLTVNLSKDAIQRTRTIHSIVAEAFHGPKPLPGYEVRHLDGNRLNNVPQNLAWGTRSENSLDQVRHGTHPNTRKTECYKGHPFDLGNTYVSGTYRRCRKCADNRRSKFRDRYTDA